MFKIFEEIKGVFVQPVKKYYLGRLAHGCPYFYPWNFVSTIIKCRKLRFKTPDKITEYEEQYPHLVNNSKTYKFSNYPMVHRAKEWTFELFGSWWFVQIGWPVYIYWNELGWKYKYDSVRFEWCPAFYIFFFNWQFCIWWTAPDGNNDKYYEMILHYLYSSKKDIVMAEKTWEWVDFKTTKSTWNKKYVINN